MKHGYTVHPAYTFGENDAYYTINIFEKFRLFLNKYKIPFIFFLGKYLLLPKDNIRLHCVIGKGLVFPLIENPTNEEIEKFHKLYITSLTSLYNRYKEQFNSTNELEIL